MDWRYGAPLLVKSSSSATYRKARDKRKRLVHGLGNIMNVFCAHLTSLKTGQAGCRWKCHQRCSGRRIRLASNGKANFTVLEAPSNLQPQSSNRNELHCGPVPTFPAGSDSSCANLWPGEFPNHRPTGDKQRHILNVLHNRTGTQAPIPQKMIYPMTELAPSRPLAWQHGRNRG